MAISLYVRKAKVWSEYPPHDFYVLIKPQKLLGFCLRKTRSLIVFGHIAKKFILQPHVNRSRFYLLKVIHHCGIKKKPCVRNSGVKGKKL